MIKASNAVISNGAAAQQDVPPTMLKDRLSGQVKRETKPGYLMTEDEQLTNFLIECCKMWNDKTEKNHTVQEEDGGEEKYSGGRRGYP